MLTELYSKPIFSASWNSIDWPLTISRVVKVALPMIVLAGLTTYLHPLLGGIVILTGMVVTLAYLIFCATVKASDINSFDEREMDQVDKQSIPDFNFQDLEQIVGPINQYPWIQIAKNWEDRHATEIAYPIMQGINKDGTRFLVFKVKVRAYRYRFNVERGIYTADKSQKPLENEVLEIVKEVVKKDGHRSICVVSQAYPQALTTMQGEVTDSTYTLGRPDILLERLDMLIQKKKSIKLLFGGFMYYYSLSDGAL